MEIQDYKVIKPPGGLPLLAPATTEGSHYYAFSEALDTGIYTEIYTKITLPTDIAWVGKNGISRNAYIALGIASFDTGATCDMGIGNIGGSGWRLCFGGLAIGDTVIMRNRYIPSGTKELILVAKNDWSRDTSGKSCMVLYAKFFGSKGIVLGEDEFVQMVPKCRWDRYYRFTSLLHHGVNDFVDGTRMMGTKFKDLSIYNRNAGRYEEWGIPGPHIESAWIVGYPNGSLWPYDTCGETFNINNQLDEQEPTTPPTRPRPQKPENPDHGIGEIFHNIISNLNQWRGGRYDKK